nr:unnamed protein product [Naegleria fowleri]
MTTHCSFFHDRELSEAIGYYTDLQKQEEDQQTLKQYVNLKLSASGLPLFGKLDKLLQITDPLLNAYKEHNRLLEDYQCPIDRRIQNFIDSYAQELKGTIDLHDLRLPSNSLELDRVGMARLLSLPGEGDYFENEIICSYRLKQGVLHNPVNDRRTTQGSFHIAQGGLLIPADKKEVPKLTWALLLKAALHPPESYMVLPYTSQQEEEKRAKCWVSIMLRPLVSPAVPGESEEKTMECRFFAPGSLVSNLDFIEAIFGNAGHAWYTANDAALDVKRWSGHTGCVILAPHLTKIPKKDLGLPHISQATERQKKEGMCYEKDTECYNEGEAFKITARTSEGVIVTIIADNYFGYCKKEVKSQITYACNLFGNCEEEHSGGAIAFPSYYLGDTFRLKDFHIDEQYRFKIMIERCNKRMEVHEDKGYATDKVYPDIIYVPEDAYFTLHGQTITWSHYETGEKVTMKLKPFVTYIFPSGYRVEMIQEKSGFALIGTVGTGTYCHKPSTISGGGKSEISKSIADAIITGPVIVANFIKDLEEVEKLINMDYSKRFKDPSTVDTRPVLSSERSLGSVVKLLTPSELFTDEYNNWLNSIPSYLKQLLFVIKSLYKPSWEGKWKEKFSVDLVNGSYGNSLKYNREPVIGHYMRVGFENNSWRTFELRKDFTPAFKIQTEDDITASVVVPVKKLQSTYLQEKPRKGLSVKLSKNVEFRLFQRPDDCIVRGYDKKAEADLATPNTFICNFEPLTQQGVQEILDDNINFLAFTKPQRTLLEEFAREGKPTYCVASSNTRVVGPNQRSKNPRYLQNSEELTKPRKYYLAEVCTRLHQVLSPSTQVVYPVDAVISGRRNNPESKGCPPLCVHNPIHYFELPELFMEYISSMTGRSPSTTGFGSEGALTKGPFCPIVSITELNTALVSMLVTGSDGFFSSAGTLGSNYRVDHDISLLIPELWCRMRPEERDPQYLIQNDMLEKMNDFEYNGKVVNASRLGYRITKKFVRAFFGRVFTNPGSVFTDDMLQPEKQSMEIFVKSLSIILDTYRDVARQYFEDGSVEGACPPLKAVLHVMAYGHYEGKSINDPEIRKMFTLESLLESNWYKERLATRQQVLLKQLQKSKGYLLNFTKQPHFKDLRGNLKIDEKLDFVEKELARISDNSYLEDILGCLGTDPYMYKQ